MHQRTSESAPSSESVGALQVVMEQVVLSGTMCGAGEMGPEALHAVMHAGGFADGQAGSELGDGGFADGDPSGAGDRTASAPTHL